MRESAVFDAYAVICFLNDEPGAKKVEQALSSTARGKLCGLVSAVNLAEVYYIAHRAGGEDYADQVLNSLLEWKVEVVPAGPELAIKAGELKAVNRLSLGDAFAAATAQLHQATLITGDPDFRALKGQIEIKWLP